MLIDAYLRSLSDLDRSPNTIRIRTFFLNRYRSDVDPGNTNANEIRLWVDGHPEWGESSRYSALASIRAMYRWALAERLIDRDPAKGMRLESPLNVHRPVADEMSIRRALRMAGLEQQMLIRLGAECGLRVHEIVKVATWDIHGTMLSVLGKGRRTRRVYVSPELRADIAEWGHQGYLFPGGQDDHRSSEWAYRTLRRLTGYPPHALRRRAAMILYQRSGHDIRLVQKFLGHANITTTMDYLGVEAEDLERAGEFTRIAA